MLHVAGGFAQHRLYGQLISHLRDYVATQYVFAPVRSQAEAAMQPNDQAGAVYYHFRHILGRRHRVLFRHKIRTIAKELEKHVDPTRCDIVHAHTLYSDGAVARHLNKRFNLPYIVAIRNTDINVFMHWRPDLFAIRNATLLNAHAIVCLSPAYRRQLLAQIPSKVGKAIEDRIAVIPNGLSAEWFSEEVTVHVDGTGLRLLYVGDLSPNKNLAGTLRAAALLAARRPVTVTIVGGGNGEVDLRRMLQRYPFARFLGRIDDPDKLRGVYRQHDIFVMPSFRETFGVVYIEALSQGLPVVHSRDQGVDGFFAEETISQAVDPHDANDIAAGIECLAERLASVRDLAIREAHRFRWPAIARRYAGIYTPVAEVSP